MTEYSHFVRTRFHQAVSHSKGGDYRHAIKNMKEKVYTADKEIHEFLKLYVPAQNDRHFLHYPIGRFFKTLFDLWNESRQEIRVDWASFKECAASGVLKDFSGNFMHLLNTTEVMFLDIEDYPGLLHRIEEYSKLFQEAQTLSDKELLQRLPLYNLETMDLVSINRILSFVQQLQGVAHRLFSYDDGLDGVISFKQHLNRIRQFVYEELVGVKTLELEEQELAKSLWQRLEKILATDIQGSIADLREALYYYLRQESSEDDEPDWIVRNFEQIEGDVLHSRQQMTQGVIYHFGYLTDQAMNPGPNRDLPWPLTREVFPPSWEPGNNRELAIYLKALESQGDFLRYALFYGLCFNQAGVRISYVKFNDDTLREQAPYLPLKILGLKLSVWHDDPPNGLDKQLAWPPIINKPNPPKDDFSRMDFVLCPQKYFLDFVLHQGIVVVPTSFAYQQYFYNMLVTKIRQSLREERNKETRKDFQRILALSKQHSNQFKKFFPFWLENAHFMTSIISAAKYVLNNPEKPGTAQELDQHMQIRLRYHKAKWVQPKKAMVHPFQRHIGSILQDEDDNSVAYSLHAVKKYQEQVNQAIDEYMDSPAILVNPGPWCKHCVINMVCVPSLKLV